MKIRFQADADLNEDIINGVRRREPTIDFRTASEASLQGLHDTIVLELAARTGRILVSHDRKTMPRYFGRLIETTMSPGLFIVSQKADPLIAVEELILIWAASDAEEWVNRVCVVPL